MQNSVSKLHFFYDFHRDFPYEIRILQIIYDFPLF
jgi:hypothetical protein